MTTKIENGTPLRSLANHCELEKNHGPLVGLIHSIMPNKTHRTLMFFTDGWVHTATGLAIGWRGQLPTQALRKLVDSMDMKPDHIALCDHLGTEERVAAEHAEKREVHYLFRLDSTAIGLRAMEKVVENLFGWSNYLVEVRSL